jgi:secretion/DNA translocation related CpaE-like protein
VRAGQGRTGRRAGAPSTGNAGAVPSRPLILSADEDLLDELVRVAAAAGVEPLVVPEPGAARASWGGAPVILVGEDQARAVGRAGLGRRAGVVLVSRQRSDVADETATGRSVWQAAVEMGAEDVVTLPSAESWLVERLCDAAEGGRRALVACVLGGRGGAGATTLAAGLAFAGLRRGMQTVLIDGDPLGGGIDLVLGGEETPGLRWPDLATARGRVAPSALRSSLPEVDELTVLSWDRGDLLDISRTAMDAVLRAAARGSDLVVIDLPRRPDAAAEVALASAHRAFLVLPAEVRAVASAGRVAAAVRGLTADLRIVVRGPAPSDLDADVVGRSIALPVAGECRSEPGLAAALERGEPPGRGRGPLARLADQLLGDLAATRPVAA